MGIATLVAGCLCFGICAGIIGTLIYIACTFWDVFR